MMIDLHSHFLPGVDDGARNIEMTREMIAQAASAGITRLLATPHVNEHTTAAAEQKIRDTFRLVQSEIDNLGHEIRIDLAAEIRFDPAIINWVKHDWILFGSERKYAIFELPIQGLPVNLREHLFSLSMKNITPIIAHPERNIVFQNQKEKLFGQIDQDIIIQVNAGSIVGQFGPGARQLAFALLRRQKVHLICSDAHETKHRNYVILKKAYEEIDREFGAATADLLFRKNPERILEGGEVQEVEITEDRKDLGSFIKKYLSFLK
jgi:protein-tyrosine phosphatase